jgi:hypothetical protein
VWPASQESGGISRPVCADVLLAAGRPQLDESFCSRFVATLGGSFQQDACLRTVPFHTCADSVVIRKRNLGDRVAIFHSLPKRSDIVRKTTRLARDDLFSAGSQFGPWRGGLLRA